MEKKAPRRPLSVKLIVLPVAIILALSSVLLITANKVNTECVTSLYYAFSKKLWDMWPMSITRMLLNISGK